MSAASVSPRFGDVSVGDELPPLEIALTRSLIVATALASRDYTEAHHDPAWAMERGSKDVFMNILSTNGFVGRFVTDWAGPTRCCGGCRSDSALPTIPATPCG
jgi:hypothetical protein